MLFWASSFAFWRHCRHRKLSAQSLPKTCFFDVFRVRGVPPRQKRSSPKTSECHQDEKSRFWYHSGPPGGVLGNPVWAPGPPSGATLHVPVPESTVWEGVWKTRQKNDANMAHKRCGWNTESKAFVRECWKKSECHPSAKRRLFRGSGGPKMMQRRPRERHYTHHGGSKVPFVASVRRLLRVPFSNDFFVRFSSTFGVRPGVRKWSRRHARAALALSIIVIFSPFSVLPCGF